MNETNQKQHFPIEQKRAILRWLSFVISLFYLAFFLIESQYSIY